MSMNKQPAFLRMIDVLDRIMDTKPDDDKSPAEYAAELTEAIEGHSQLIAFVAAAAFCTAQFAAKRVP